MITNSIVTCMASPKKSVAAPSPRHHGGGVVPTSFKLPSDMVEMIDAVADAENRSRASVVRLAIKAYLAPYYPAKKKGGRA